MSAIPSLLRKHWIELAWSAWIALNVVAIVLVPAGETIPFHFIWLSLAVVYGVRLWKLGATLWILLGICVISGTALTIALLEEQSHLDEITEVPMMGMLFLAMVWFATRWKLAAEELRRGAARERDFVRDASHQLRTPITVAHGHLELVRSEALDRQALEDLDVALGELDRLARISDSLLFLATAEHVQSVARAPVDLSRAVTAAIQRWRVTAPREWALSVGANGTLLGDEERIDAALDALIENAVKATEAGDRIAVDLRSRGDVAVIEVRDSGMGMPPEDLERVFDRFWRTGQPPPPGNRGTGLGLAIVKATAEAHGGSVEASRNPDGGATFRMRLGGFVPLLWPMVRAGSPRADKLENGSPTEAAPRR